jgi:site-specific DNA-methyltransferase (adenine-specific)
MRRAVNGTNRTNGTNGKSHSGLAVDQLVRVSNGQSTDIPTFSHGRARLYWADCMECFAGWAPESIHAVVTDPPYGLVEYSPKEQRKLRNRHGGIWRIPPEIGGSKRAPLPRFTVLSTEEKLALTHFFRTWGERMMRVLVPGAHVFIASNPLLNFYVAQALVDAGYERRGEIVRLVRTLKGGDRPKLADKEFPSVSVIPRSAWESWGLFRKPFAGRASENLRRYGTGALRRPSQDAPFVDVIKSSRTPRRERAIAPHPSLKPQSFLRELVYAALPLGTGVVLDPFAGSGSTLAAANAIGYNSVGIEIDRSYVAVARRAIPRLGELEVILDRPLEANGEHADEVPLPPPQHRQD